MARDVKTGVAITMLELVAGHVRAAVSELLRNAADVEALQIAMSLLEIQEELDARNVVPAHIADPMTPRASIEAARGLLTTSGIEPDLCRRLAALTGQMPPTGEC